MRDRDETRTFHQSEGEWSLSVYEGAEDNFYFIKTDGYSMWPIMFKKIEMLVEYICNSEAKQALFSFLNQYITGFEYISAVSKEKISKSFEMVELLPNQILFHEGQTTGFVYLIFEGEMKFTSDKNPLKAELKQG